MKHPWEGLARHRMHRTPAGGRSTGVRAAPHQETLS